MSSELKVGIAGYGVVGKRRREHIDAHPQMRVIAVCDKTIEEDRYFGDGASYYNNYRKLLEEDLDVLFVCLTNDIAPEVTIAGLNNGQHVFCEKPPGRTVDDILGVIECEKKHPGVKLKYGFNHRYHKSIVAAMEMVRSGELGRIINLRGIYGKSRIIAFDQSDWRSKREIAGGGILLDQGIHIVDLMRLFAGEFEDIYSFVRNDFWHHDVEDNVYAMMRTENGIIAMLHSSATQWRHRFSLDITLEKGSLIMSGILSGSKSYGAETLIIARSGNGDGAPSEQMESYDYDSSWRDEIDDFADAIISDRPIANGTSEDALKTMQLVYRIYCADDEWREKWNL